jgi:hypothetical protein
LSSVGNYCLLLAMFYPHMYPSIYSGEIKQHAQRLTLSVMDTFIADLKDSVREAKEVPSGKGTMVAVYGAFPFLLFFIFFLSIISIVLYEWIFHATLT